MIEKVKQIYEITGFKMPILEKDNQIVDIDPFTVFGLFNKKLTDANRITSPLPVFMCAWRHASLPG